MSVTIKPEWLKSLKFNYSNLSVLNKWYKYELDERYVGDKLGGVFLIKHSDSDYYYLHKMKPYKNKDGYMELVLTNKHGNKKHVMNQIASKGIWDDKPKDCKHVNHDDGDRSNNKLSNLIWSTISDNIKHSYRVLGRVVNRRGPAKK